MVVHQLYGGGVDLILLQKILLQLGKGHVLALVKELVLLHGDGQHPVILFLGRDDLLHLLLNLFRRFGNGFLSGFGHRLKRLPRQQTAALPADAQAEVTAGQQQRQQHGAAGNLASGMAISFGAPRIVFHVLILLMGLCFE